MGHRCAGEAHHQPSAVSRPGGSRSGRRAGRCSWRRPGHRRRGRCRAGPPRTLLPSTATPRQRPRPVVVRVRAADRAARRAWAGRRGAGRGHRRPPSAGSAGTWTRSAPRAWHRPRPGAPDRCRWPLGSDLARRRNTMITARVMPALQPHQRVANLPRPPPSRLCRYPGGRPPGVPRCGPGTGRPGRGLLRVGVLVRRSGLGGAWEHPGGAGVGRQCAVDAVAAPDLVHRRPGEVLLCESVRFVVRDPLGSRERPCR